jgi:orotate phosphoribosyltransferase
MNNSEIDFLKFAIASKVLRFGEFTLKSGRVSPYFFDAGLFNTGHQIFRLGHFYAAMLAVRESESFMLYGPAYKGIPLASAAAAALASEHDIDVGFAFNRKESKDHGEGGTVIGAPLSGRVVIIDDVITAGLSIEESVRIIRSAGAEPVAVAIALDREETMTTGGLSALTEVESRFGLPVYAIARFSALIDYLQLDEGLRRYVPTMTAYRDAYGSD